MRTVKAVGLGLIIAIIVVFVVENIETFQHTQQLTLDLYLFSVTTPPLFLWVLLLLSFLAGFFLAYSKYYLANRNMKKTIKNLESMQGRTEEELHSLRNLPITGAAAGNDQNGGYPGELS